MCSLLRALDMHVCAQSGLATPARPHSFSCHIGKSHSIPDCPPLLCQEPVVPLHSLPKKFHSLRSAAVWGGKTTQHIMSWAGPPPPPEVRYFMQIFLSLLFCFFFLVRTGMCSFSEIFKIRVRGWGRIPEFILMAHAIPLKIGEQIWKALCLNATGTPT